MLRYIEKEDRKLGFKYKNYYLPQGDSFTFTATEKGEQVVDGEQTISSVVFKLGVRESDCIINLIYQQDYIRNEDGVWVCKVSGETTKAWKPTCDCNEEPYVYEIELTYSDGNPVTLTSGEFYITPQIVGGE